MKIAVIGMGYVGLSNSILLAQNNQVVGVDLVADKVDKVNSGLSPIMDREAEEYLQSGTLHLAATTDMYEACKDAEFVIVATPTDYNPEQNSFNTSSVEAVVQQTLQINPQTTIVVKSTVPVGFTKTLCEKFRTDHILFSPEFLREGRAIYDNLYPSRIVVGTVSHDPLLRKRAETFGAFT